MPGRFRAVVERAIYMTTMLAMNRLARMTSELIKLKPDGTVDETTHRGLSYEIPRDWSLEAAATGPQRNFSRWMRPVGVRRLSWRSPGWCSGLVG
jgi:hypothetical protein